MTEKNSFGSILRRLLEEKQKKRIERKQWSKTAVAKKLKVSRVTLDAWLNDEWPPDADNLKLIIELFQPSEEDETALRRAVGQLPPEKKKLPSRNTLFTGRNDYLDKLRQLLQEGGSVALTQAVSISGLGGIGKTQIALEYAHQHHPDVYRTVLWANVADQATLRADYDAIARLLELPERDEQDANLRVEAVKRWLDEHSRWLLIMDNADDLQLARSFMPGRLLGHIILTTCSQAIRESNIAVQLVVDEMKPQEAVIFLLRRAGWWDEESELNDEAKLAAITADIRGAGADLVMLLGGHPLALDQAGAYIDGAKISVSDYIQRYNTRRRDLLSKRKLLERKSNEQSEDTIQHPDSVVTTFMLSFEKAGELRPLASDILRFCAFLQSDAIPEELFQYDDTFKPDIVAFDEAMGALQLYSLIKRNEQDKILSIHRLVQAVLIDDMSLDMQKQWKERAVRALHAAFPEVKFENWRQCERLLPHALVCARWTDDKLAPTVEVGELLHKAGVYLRAQGQYPIAETLLSQSLMIYEQHFGAEHLETASALHDLAILHFDQGKYSQAEPLYHHALAVVESQLGSEHPRTAKILNNLAAFYLRQEEWEQAEPLLIRALSIQEKCLDIEHPDTARTMYNLALIYLYQANIEHSEDKLERSQDLYHRALAIQEKTLGAEHPETAKSLLMLASLYSIQGQFEQAEALYRQALEIFEKHLGSEHPNIAPTLYGLSTILYLQGKHEQAEALYRHSLSILEQQFGATHQHIQRLKEVYVGFQRNIVRDAEAAALEVNDEPPEQYINPPS